MSRRSPTLGVPFAAALVLFAACSRSASRAPCVGEPDLELCATGQAECGVLEVADRCGVQRTIDCGSCTEPYACGVEQPNRCTCVPEQLADLCASVNADCGSTATVDRCGAIRDLACGVCPEGSVCGGAGELNRCGCQGPSDAELCAILSQTCGRATAVDVCGRVRSVSCGSCANGSACATDRSGSCGCASTAETCARLGLECGSARIADPCRPDDPPLDCGACESPMVCGASGLANRCGCEVEPDAQFCARIGKHCGVVYAPDRCGAHRRADCGACPDGELCGGGGVENQCAPRWCQGDGWCWENPLPQGMSLNAVWGADPQDAWAVGEGGILLHWDGARWSPVPSPTRATLTGVWGTDATHAWSVGSDSAGQGVLLRHDGGHWSVVAGASLPALNAIGGTSASNAWIVGEGGTLLRLNLAGWVAQSAPTQLGINGVTTFPNGGALIASDAGVHEFDGASWIARPEWTGRADWIWGTSPQDFWVGRWGIYHYWGVGRRAQWSLVGSADNPPVYTRVRFHASPGGATWVGATVTYSFDPPEPQLGQVGAPASLSFYLQPHAPILGFWGTASDVWAVGESGLLMHYDGEEWHDPNASPSTALSAVSLLVDGSLIAGGDLSPLLQSSGNGEWSRGSQFASYPSFRSISIRGEHAGWGLRADRLWSPCCHSTYVDALTATGWTSVGQYYDVLMNAVWAASDTDAWAVGDSGALMHCTLQACTVASQRPTAVDLHAIWGSSPTDIWAAGDEATLLHYDGVTWSAVASPVAAPTGFTALWGTGSGTVWALAVQGSTTSVLRYDGTAWTSEASTTETLNALCGSGANDVWAVGASGAVLHRSGGRWAESDTGMAKQLRACAASATAGVWAVGDGGAILHRAR